MCANNLFGEGFFAVLALHAYLLPHGLDPETAAYRFLVADAIGIGAVKYPFNRFRQLQLQFTHHLEVFDDVDGA